MSRHPYRIADERPAEDRGPRRGPDLEGDGVTAVLLIVGSLGVIVGIVRPTRNVELVLGLALLLFGLRNAFSFEGLRRTLRALRDRSERPRSASVRPPSHRSGGPS